MKEKKEKKEEVAERDFKYFYNVIGNLCRKDSIGLIVASEKLIKKSEIKGCAKEKYISLFKKEVQVGDVVNIIFGDPRSANGLKKLSEAGENLPDFINDRGDSDDFAVYEFLNGKKAILDEWWVCDRNAKIE
ncbi:hypothetical protein ACFL1Y_01040 [Patescibacteria group bacterium]